MDLIIDLTRQFLWSLSGPSLSGRDYGLKDERRCDSGYEGHRSDGRKAILLLSNVSHLPYIFPHTSCSPR